DLGAGPAIDRSRRRNGRPMRGAGNLARGALDVVVCRQRGDGHAGIALISSDYFHARNEVAAPLTSVSRRVRRRPCGLRPVPVTLRASTTLIRPTSPAWPLRQPGRRPW